MAFVTKISGTGMSLKGLKGQAKEGTKIMQEGRALYCEGLLASSLQNPMDKSSRPCVRSELGDIAGSKISEPLIQPVLLSAAREFIG